MCFALLFVISTVIRAWATLWLIDWAIFAALFFLVALVFSAFSTSIHEWSHLAMLEELGFHVDNFVIHRIGNVSFRIKDGDRMTLDEVYRVSRAPFVRPAQYVVDAVGLSILAVIDWFSPFPLNIVLIVFLFLLGIVILGNLCALRVIRSRLVDGLCVSLARSVTSREDIDDIVEWNKSQTSLTDVSRNKGA